MNATPQPDRNAALLALVQSGASLKEAGRRFGITRERVRQIWRRAFPNGPSSREMKRARGPTVMPCSRCGRKPRWPLRTYQHDLCWPCRKEAHKRVITCVVCGGTRTIYSPAHVAQDKGLYCSKRCFGIWLAKHHGIGTPGNPGNKGQTKEFCLRGHPLSGANLYVWNGFRQCRACQKIRRARYYAARRLG